VHRLKILVVAIALATVTLPVSEALAIPRLSLMGKPIQHVLPETVHLDPVPPPRPTLVPDVRKGLEYADSPAAAAAEISRLDKSPSIVDGVLTEAACEGFTTVVNTHELPNEQDFAKFLLARAARRLAALRVYYYASYLEGKVDQMAAIGNLVEYGYAGHQVALRYAQACWIANAHR